MRAIRSRMSFANVVSVIALFVALGGSAYAATQLKKNSVGTKQIKAGAITGAKVKEGTLTGKNIDVGTLGTVPSASHSATADTATVASVASTLVAPEAPHIVGTPGQPQFEDGSTNYVPGPFEAEEVTRVSFWKDSEGLVHLEGNAQTASAGGGELQSIFTLPPGFRPAKGHIAIFDPGSFEEILVAGTEAKLERKEYSGNVLAGEDIPVGFDITFKPES